MKLKTYRARTIADALEQVKKDLGREAMILHTRTYRVGGWLGFGGRNMFEVTASSSQGAAHPARARLNAQRQTPGETAPDPVAVAARLLRQAYAQQGARPAAAESAPASSVIGGAIAGGPGATATISTQALQRSAEPAAPSISASSGIAAGQVDGTAFGSTSGAAAGPMRDVSPMQTEMAQELAAIKTMVARVLSSGPRIPGPPAGAPDALMPHYLRMLEAEVATDIADEVVHRVRGEMTRAQMSDEKAVQKAVLRALAAYIPVAPECGEPAPERAPDGRPFTIALVGPTGVGKTTTIAKLAATYKLRHGRKVGLVTADTYRIAAVEQLRVYANIIGLPLNVAMTPAEMGSACRALADRDVILIDTAGRSHNDDGKLDELRTYLDAAKPHRVHLVLSSAASEASMIKSAERFARVGPERVIFTKLDEAVNFGVLVNVARKINATLSYVTTGQEVPDRIESGRAERLARMVLEGTVGK